MSKFLKNKRNKESFKPIFISGRFRSGSTLLWNIFRNIPECNSFYEPCHDLLLTHVECNTAPQSSHVGVTSYWDEYLPILSELKQYHSIDFGYKNLFLEPQDQYDSLEKYIRFLIECCEDIRPVLQFNRVDFRLPWLRKKFPEAVIIHLYRNPREQWYSMVRSLPRDLWLSPQINTDYELMTWSCALAPVFPFLHGAHIKTSYHRHYLLWKLSKNIGLKLSDMSIDFDNDLLVSPEMTISKLADAASMKIDTNSLSKLVVSPSKGGWLDVNEEEWFKSVETECDEIIFSLGLDKLGEENIETIRNKNSEKWEKYTNGACNLALDMALSMFHDLRSSNVRLGSDSKRVIGIYEKRLDHIASKCDLSIALSFQDRLTKIATACDLTKEVK